MYRIGELARRTGTTTDLLRVWERRYGLLRPRRTPGGFRVYTDADAARVEAMREALGRGLAAAEAAESVLAGVAEPAEGTLLDALLGFDDAGAHTLLDEAFSRFSLEAVLHDLVLPALRAIGDGWERGEVTVAQEHFAASLLRGRLLGHARRWDQGVGRRALLACAPGDLHDLPLIAFGLALRARGWRILFLGANTPLEVLAATAAGQRPDLVVVASAQVRPELGGKTLAPVAAAAPLALAGRWPDVDVDAIRLEGDPVDLAASLDVNRR